MDLETIKQGRTHWAIAKRNDQVRIRMETGRKRQQHKLVPFGCIYQNESDDNGTAEVI